MVMEDEKREEADSRSMTETKYSSKDVLVFLSIPEEDHIEYLQESDKEDRIHPTDNTLFSPSPHRQEDNSAYEETVALSAEYKRRRKENSLTAKIAFVVLFITTGTLFGLNLDNPIFALLLVMVTTSLICYGFFVGKIVKYREEKIQKMQEVAEKQVELNLNAAVKRWGERNGFWEASNEELIWDEYNKFLLLDELLVAWQPLDDGWFQLVKASDKTPITLADFPAVTAPVHVLSSDVTGLPVNITQ